MDDYDYSALDYEFTVPEQILNFLIAHRHIFAFFSLLVNLFHLIILTRKPMRSSSINILMIGIAACDVSGMHDIIWMKVTTWIPEADNPKW